MTAFFICIILVGVFVVCTALVWIVIDRKNARDYRLELDEHRYELEHVIEDAEQLLNELNSFSDYIVTRMEEKQQSVESVFKAVEKHLGQYEYERVHGEMNKIPEKWDEQPEQQVQEMAEAEQKQEDFCEVGIFKTGKVIPLDVKKREVLKLCNNGVDSTKIAKMLHMGKGEIELISRMCK